MYCNIMSLENKLREDINMNKNLITVTAVVNGTTHRNIEINIKSDVKGTIESVLGRTNTNVGDINEWKLTFNNQTIAFEVKIEDAQIMDGSTIFIDPTTPGGGGNNA